MMENEEVHQICTSTIAEISNLEITADSIKMEAQKDEELSKIKQELQSTFVESEYILDHGILFKSGRVVIPRSLQPVVLAELHSIHIGITRMKQLARRLLWTAYGKISIRTSKGR